MSPQRKIPTGDRKGGFRWHGTQLTGEGTGIADVYDPTAQVDEGVSVFDERMEKLLCRKCGQEVTHRKKSNGKFSVRNLDGTAHRKTCGK